MTDRTLTVAEWVDDACRYLERAAERSRPLTLMPEASALLAYHLREAQELRGEIEAVQRVQDDVDAHVSRARSYYDRAKVCLGWARRYRRQQFWLFALQLVICVATIASWWLG